MIQDLRHIVEQCKAKHPEAWKHAHTGNAHTEDFIRLLAPMLKAVDKRFGLNGKRGSLLDISDDAVNVLCDPEDSDGRTPEGQPCAVIDVIGSAGATPPYTPQNPVPFVAWGVYRTLREGSGANVDPRATPTQPPQPPQKPYPGDHVWDAVGAVLFTDYAEARQSPNPQMGRWFGRTIWDATEGDETGMVLTVDASIKKHRGEWRAVLGLPPL